MTNNHLLIRQLDSKISLFQQLCDVMPLTEGWIKTLRVTLNISFHQLGVKMDMTPQGVKGIESREKTGGLTLKTMNRIAGAMDMRFVYGFVPRDGSLEKLIEKKAYEAARKIVERTNVTMKLEDQENSPERIRNAIKELAEDIAREVPKRLWD